MPYTNDFKDMADLDPAMRLMGQREVLLAAVRREIFCPISGVILDRSRAVLVMPSQGPMVVMDAAVFDEKHEFIASSAAAADVTFEVYDGRELWS
jgi:hypothetical protein